MCNMYNKYGYCLGGVVAACCTKYLLFCFLIKFLFGLESLSPFCAERETTSKIHAAGQEWFILQNLACCGFETIWDCHYDPYRWKRDCSHAISKLCTKLCFACFCFGIFIWCDFPQNIKEGLVETKFIFRFSWICFVFGFNMTLMRIGR